MIDFIKIFSKAEYFTYPCPHFIASDIFTEKQLENIDKNYPKSKEIYQLISEPGRIYNQNTSYQIEYQKLKGISNDSNYIYEILEKWMAQRKEIINFLKELPFANNYPNEFFDINNSYSKAFVRASSPVIKNNTTQLGPHYDNPKTLFTGMIYLRDKNDDSAGGNFTFYKIKKNASSKLASKKRRIELENLTPIKTIPYKRNTALFFIPDKFSIHGIDSRGITTFDRRLLNLFISFKSEKSLKMFDLEEIINKDLKLSFLKRLMRKIKFRRNITDKYGIYDWIDYDKL